MNNSWVIVGNDLHSKKFYYLLQSKKIFISTSVMLPPVTLTRYPVSTWLAHLKGDGEVMF